MEGATMRILVATDGSADASNAIEWLLHFPLPPDAVVGLVIVAPRPIFHTDTVAWAELQAHTQGLLEDARARLAKRWPTVTADVLYGDPRDTICNAAYRRRADLIVLGARGLGAISAFLVGSVSLGVARQAPCAVLVCKGAPRPVQTVTVALDGSPDSAAAFRFFSALALPGGLTARLLGVVQPLGRYPSSAPDLISPALMSALMQYEDGLRQELQAPLDEAARMLTGRVGSIVKLTPAGLPANEIVQDAADSDLVVVGARGLGPLKRVLLGSVSENVLAHASCPVLVVRTRS
jgi:nucleotide-binding universal stress UspA family protein